MLDPQKKYFKNRYYKEDCVLGKDGELLKDLSPIEKEFQLRKSAKCMPCRSKCRLGQ
jgi:TFIIF-interacting CTD phosphatase-like protein